MSASLPVVCEPRHDLRSPDVREAVTAAAILSDPTRASILRMLAAGPICVCELATALGLRENNVSNHLARLRLAGLVRATRHQANARFQYYERDEVAVARARAVLDDLLR